MNKENLIKLRDFLRNLPDSKFDWSTVHEVAPECGTAGCIVGWAPFVFNEATDMCEAQRDGETRDQWRSRMDGKVKRQHEVWWRAVYKENDDKGETEYLMDKLGLPKQTASWLIYARNSSGRKDQMGGPLYAKDGMNARNGREIAIRRLSAIINGCVT